MSNFNNILAKYVVAPIAAAGILAGTAFAGAKPQFGGMLKSMTPQERAENLSRGVDFLERHGIEAFPFEETRDGVTYHYFRNDDIDGDGKVARVKISENAQPGSVVFQGDISYVKALYAVRGDDGKVRYRTSMVFHPVNEAISYMQGPSDAPRDIAPDRMSVVGFIGYDANKKPVAAKAGICYDERNQLGHVFDGKQMWVINMDKTEKPAKLEKIVEKEVQVAKVSPQASVAVPSTVNNINLELNQTTEVKAGEQEYNVNIGDRVDMGNGLSYFELDKDHLLFVDTQRRKDVQEMFKKTKGGSPLLAAILSGMNVGYSSYNYVDNNMFTRTDVGHYINENSYFNHGMHATGPCDVMIDERFGSQVNNNLFNQYTFQNARRSGKFGGMTVAFNGGMAGTIYANMVANNQADRRWYASMYERTPTMFIFDKTTGETVNIDGVMDLGRTMGGTPGSRPYMNPKEVAQARRAERQMLRNGASTTDMYNQIQAVEQARRDALRNARIRQY